MKKLDILIRDYVLKDIEDLQSFWTIKESYVKYIGTGLLTSLKSFRVDVSNKRIIDLCDTDNYDVIKYSKETVPNYYMSVCGKNEQALIKRDKIGRSIYGFLLGNCETRDARSQT